MEYVITSERAFDEVETLTTGALQRYGFVVQRTFSLHSATQATGSNDNPGYSVFMIYGTDREHQPVGLLTLYQRSGQTVINSVLTSPLDEDVDANLVADLVLSGLEFCIDAAGSGECIDPRQAGEGAEPLIRDPVCGKRFDRDQAEAAIEYEGRLFYVCCPLCREEFESAPAHFVRSR